MIDDLQIADEYNYTREDLYPIYTKKTRAVNHAAFCEKNNCEYCEFLCNSGIIISCDECGYIHHTDWKGWEMNKKWIYSLSVMF